MDKLPKKKPQILIKSISMIRLNQNNPTYINDNNEMHKNNSAINIYKNKEYPIKIKKNIILGFKKSLFSFSKKKINSMTNNFLPVSLLSQKSKTSFKKDNKVLANNSNSSIKYLEDNNSSSILPTKSSLMPIYDSTGKNYINSSAGKIMNKIITKNNNISDFSRMTNGNKNSEISLPNIENKKLENYSFKNSFQNQEIITNKKKLSHSLLNNKEFKFLFS